MPGRVNGDHNEHSNTNMPKYHMAPKELRDEFLLRRLFMVVAPML